MLNLNIAGQYETTSTDAEDKVYLEFDRENSRWQLCVETFNYVEELNATSKRITKVNVDELVPALMQVLAATKETLSEVPN